MILKNRPVARHYPGLQKIAAEREEAVRWIAEENPSPHVGGYVVNRGFHAGSLCRSSARPIVSAARSSNAACILAKSSPRSTINSASTPATSPSPTFPAVRNISWTPGMSRQHSNADFPVAESRPVRENPEQTISGGLRLSHRVSRLKNWRYEAESVHPKNGHSKPQITRMTRMDWMFAKRSGACSFTQR